MAAPDDRKSTAPDATKSVSPAKRRYEKPRLTDYGHVSKLTLTGGITTNDNGHMARPCL